MNANKYFKAHPKVDKFFFTTDGQAFFKENDARNHQKSLTGKPGDVKVAKRGEKRANENAEEIKGLEEKVKSFQELLLDAKDPKEKAGIEENIKKLRDEIAKLK